MNRCRTVFAALILAVFPATHGLAQQAELDALVEDYRVQAGLTGVSLAILDGGGTITATAGTRDGDGDGSGRITPDTRFYIASSGKSAVAAAILAYVADGALDLDDPALPLVADITGVEAIDNIDAVTVRQLLDHTSGLDDYLDDDFMDAAFDAGMAGISLERALSGVYGTPAFFQPGEGFEYSNTNYLLLGHILARLGGSISAAIEDKVIGPAGMTNTTIGLDAPTGTEARGRVDGVDFSAVSWSNTYGDGPLVSTAADLARFAQALFGEKVLIPDALLTEMVAGSDQEPSYGLGMGIEEDELGIWYGHTGGFDGFEADFRYYPELGTAIAYAANGESSAEDSLIDVVVAAWLEDSEE